MIADRLTKEGIAYSYLDGATTHRSAVIAEFAEGDAANGGGGGFVGFLRELSPTSALFDFNHPLAGKTVCFEVQIIAIL